MKSKGHDREKERLKMEGGQIDGRMNERREGQEERRGEIKWGDVGIGGRGRRKVRLKWYMR